MSHRLNIYHIYRTTACARPEDYYCRCCAHFLLIFSYFFHFTKLRLLFTVACNSQPQKRIQVQTFKFNIKYVLLAYACKTEGKNGISRLISALCVNCLISIPEYSRIIDYSIIWMCIWCGLLQKLYKIKKSELLNSKVYSKV